VKGSAKFFLTLPREITYRVEAVDVKGEWGVQRPPAVKQAAFAVSFTKGRAYDAMLYFFLMNSRPVMGYKA
jgi:hypothetical protein